MSNHPTDQEIEQYYRPENFQSETDYSRPLEELINAKKLEFEMSQVALIDAVARCKEAGIPEQKIFRFVVEGLKWTIGVPPTTSLGEWFRQA